MSTSVNLAEARLIVECRFHVLSWLRSARVFVVILGARVVRKESNRISHSLLMLFENVRNNSCVDTQIGAIDTQDLPFLAISVYRDPIPVCRD